MLEPLRHEVAEQPLELAVVGDCRATSEPSFECCGQECVGVEIREDMRHGFLGQRSADTGGFDLSPDPQAPASSHACLGVRDRRGDATVVERAFGEETRHGRIDLVGWIVTTSEALANLCLRQFASGQQLQAGKIRASGQTS